MKKYLFSFLSAIIVINSFGQSIPNGGFESWIINNYENPVGFNTANYQDNNGVPGANNVTKTTDAYHGNFAIKLTTVGSGTNANFAYFAIGDPGKNPPRGGLPYTQKPLGLRLYYKSSVLPNDTALVLAVFKKAGVSIGTYIYRIAGTKTAYTLFNVNFSPALSVNPDTVVIAATSSNAFAGYGLNGSMLQLDSITFTGVSSQPANFNSDFEQWMPLQNEKLTGWNSRGASKRTTDLFSGNYAVELQTVIPPFGGSGPDAGEANTGYNIPGGVGGGLPYTQQIDTLVLEYKYIPADPNDNGELYVYFKKNGVQIYQANGYFYISPSYKKLVLPFNVGSMPDSINIMFRSSKYPVLNSYAGSDLKVDNLYLTSQNIPISDFAAPPFGCVGQNIQLIDKSGNMANAWGWIMPGGNPGSSTAQSPTVFYNSPGTKTISMIASNSFGSGSLVSKSITIFTVPVVASTSTVTACGGGNAVLTASGANTFTWSTGSNSSTISVTPTITTIYTVTGTTNGCSDSGVGAVVVPLVPKPDICMVTVDSLNKFNEIYWDKTSYPNLDSMIIYREVISNTYKRIGAVSKSALSMFVDTLRSIGPANGDPNISTYRYKIQVRDTCGQYGPKSLWHNTVYFTHSAGTFFWTNNYMIEGPLNPVQTYSLMVNINPTVATSSYSLVGTTTGNQSTLNDPFYVFYSSTADWRVVGDLGYSCTSTQRYGNGGNSVLKTIVTKTSSNIQNNRVAIGINEISFKNKFRVYPNPTNGVLNIDLVSSNDEMEVSITNVLGQIVYADKINKGVNNKTLNVSSFAKGVYSLMISSQNSKAVYKVVVE